MYAKFKGIQLQHANGNSIPIHFLFIMSFVYKTGSNLIILDVDLFCPSVSVINCGAVTGSILGCEWPKLLQ